jgi:hypothetical protein
VTTGYRRRAKPPPSLAAAICKAWRYPELFTDRVMHETGDSHRARAVVAAIVEQCRARNGDELALIVAEILSEQS